MQDVADLTKMAEFVTRFGFLGIGLLFALLLAPFFLKVMNSKPLAILCAMLGIVFGVIFAAIDVIRTAAPGLLPARTVMVSGSLRQVDSNLAALVRSDLEEETVAYARREYDRNVRDKVNVPFFFLTRDRELPSCLLIELRPLVEGGREVNIGTLANEPLLMNVPLEKEDLLRGLRQVVTVELGGGRITGTLQRRLDGADVTPATPLRQLGDNERACGAQLRKTSGFRLVSTAWAQGAPRRSTQETIARLQSSDPNVRRDARIDLSTQGTAAFDTIKGLLGTSDYRLQIGAAAAVAAMPDEVRRQTPPAVRQQLQALLRHSDQTMRDTAKLALR